jgi:predicted RecB family nuclease
MQERDGRLILSATDLSHSLDCAHRTARDLAVLRRELPAPRHIDAITAALAARGLAHEERYLDQLVSQGRTLHRIDPEAPSALDDTRAAMAQGANVIAQASLRHHDFQGRADVLLRVARPSALGPWSYEAVDTKLSEQTRAGTVLQLALYSALLSVLQGVEPEHFWVVTPEAGAQQHRLADFAAYFRRAQRLLREATRAPTQALLEAHYPEPVEHCDVCRHFTACRDKRRADDHLSRVAGLTRRQRRSLESAGIRTLTAFAAAPALPPVKRGAEDALRRAQRQARMQHEAERTGRPHYELRPLEPELGLGRLPAPSEGDVFLDIEGDHLADSGGREYLFGLTLVEADGLRHERFWATTPAEERDAFARVIDLLSERHAHHPAMHVYHYAPYEPAALKRLMGRHVTREAELDALLRACVFVDLYQAVREAMVAGVERYSIKDLEPYYGFTREVELRDASRALRSVEQALYFRAVDALAPGVRDTVERYNREDCVSAHALRGWLERLRAAEEAKGATIPRPLPPEHEAREEADAKKAELEALRARLLDGVPADAAERTPAQSARHLLAYLLDFHAREQKTEWWEYYRMCALSPEEYLDEKHAVAGLEFVERLSITAKGVAVDRYRYPAQECDVRKGHTLKTRDEQDFGKVVEIDRRARTLSVHKPGKAVDLHPGEAFVHDVVPLRPLPSAIEAIARWVADHGIDADGPYRAARDLLLGRAPRLHAGQRIERAAGETPLQHAVRVIGALDHSVLPIQGPPGTGKSFTASHAICSLAEQGLRIGVCAPSHEVVHKLLLSVTERARERGVPVGVLAKHDKKHDQLDTLHDNKKALARLAQREVNVLGGTSWLWAGDDAAEAVDVLFIDEAGQLSLASTLAASRAAKSVVLIGDPQQLDQPMKGSHPDGVAVSALRHLLGEHDTIPAERGLFLADTYRLPPPVNAFISELFYESRLHTKVPGGVRALSGTAGFDGTGLWFLPVSHSGCKSSSEEEVEAIRALVARLLTPGARWTDGERARPLTTSDILVVVPYNAQQVLLEEALPTGVRVGTVDKFQGQEAPVVIYGMTTSSADEAPRGMDFLYSHNRLNVAISRAQGAAVLVASPGVLEAAGKTVKGVRLLNAFCRYVEVAGRVNIEA